MHTRLTFLAALAGALAFVGGAIASDHGVPFGEDAERIAGTADLGIPVFRAVDALVRVDPEALRSGATRHPDAGAPLPITLRDCGDCTPGFLSDNISPLLGNGAHVEPIVDLTDPFFVDNGLIGSDGRYNDRINGSLFSDLDPALLRRVAGPATVCGLLSTYLDVGGDLPLREVDALRLDDAVLLAQNAGSPILERRVIILRLRYAYDAILQIQPAVGQDGFAAIFTFGEPILGGINFPGVEPFGTCESFTFAIDFNGFLSPGQEDYVFSLLPSLITPDGFPADVDYSLQFFVEGPLECEANGCADTDESGVVDVDDLMNVLSDFGQTAGADGTVGGGDKTDLDCDGLVDLRDLLGALAQFGTAGAGCE